MVIVLINFKLIAQFPINYNLLEPGRVSINIYNPEGNVVRELKLAEHQEGGSNSVNWDGNDNNGNPVSNAAECTWKLLSTPNGLTADFIMNIGGNYPKKYDENKHYSAAPIGNHIGPRAVTIDNTSVYLGADGPEGVAGIVRLTKEEPQQRVSTWSRWSPFAGPVSMARAKGNLLYLLGGTRVLGGDRPPTTVVCRMNITNSYTTNNTGDTIFSYVWDGFNVTDLDANDSDDLVLSYPDYNRIRWITSGGKGLDWAEVPNPQGVSLAHDGTVFVTTGDKICKLTRENKSLVDVVTGLTNPGRLDIDHGNGDIYVVVGNNREYVKRYSSSGLLKNSYGDGYPTDGLYDPKRFATLSDISATGDGESFFITEPEFVRRTIRVNSGNGDIINELYGGLPWAPWITVEPDNPSVAWMCGNTGETNNGGEHYAMRLVLDYTENSYKIHSVYKLTGKANGLLGVERNGKGWIVRKRASDGVKYLCRSGHEGSSHSLPVVLKIDETNWELKPVTICGFGIPDFMKPWAGSSTAWQWNDFDGDGQVQKPEVEFYTVGFGYRGWGTSVDSDLNYWFITDGTAENTNGVKRLGVVSWNSIGSPVYDFPYWTARGKAPNQWNSKGSIVRWTMRDVPADMTYAEYQNMEGWNNNTGYARLVKYDGSGNLIWQVGKYGPYTDEGPSHLGHANSQGAPGTIHAVRYFAGIAHGCPIMLDFNGGWNNASLPITYVWDENGLWVGSMFDNVNAADHKKDFWLQSDNLAGDIYYDSISGKTMYFACGENQGYVYNITGWDNWEKQSGSVIDIDTNYYSIQVEFVDSISGESVNGLDVSFNWINFTSNDLGMISLPDLKQGSYKLFLNDTRYVLAINGIIEVRSDSIIRAYVNKLPHYSIQLEFINSLSGKPLEGLEVIFNQAEYITGEQGIIPISELLGGSYSIELPDNRFQIENNYTIEILSDSLIHISVIRFPQLNIKVMNLTNGSLINRAMVMVNDLLYVSNQGLIEIGNYAADTIIVSTSHIDYFPKNDTLIFTDDSTFTLFMTPKKAHVTFTVSDLNGPLNGVKVIMSGTQYTNSVGNAFFFNKAARMEYAYSLEKAGYSTIKDTLYLEIDTTLKLNLDYITSSREMELKDFTIHPNPFDDYIVISIRENGRLYLYDISGVLRYSTILEQGMNTLPMHHLKNGGYLLRIISGENVYNKLIIKQKNN